MKTFQVSFKAVLASQAMLKTQDKVSDFSVYFPHASHRLSMADAVDQSRAARAEARAIFIFKIISPLTRSVSRASDPGSRTTWLFSSN